MPADPAQLSQCAGCGAPLSADQRYCLECGERRVAMSGFLMSGGPVAGEPAPASPPPAPVSSSAAAPRSGTLNVIAGVGVLMLAMGVGVLIGRSGATKPSSPPPQVITVGSVGAGTSTSTGTSEAFTGDWPAGSSGYTVQLQKLPLTGSTVAEVQAAKSAATAKGATGVGALKSDEFSSLTAGSYVIYAGIQSSRAAAQKQLAGLKGKFPGASVIHVADGAAGAGGAAKKAAGSSSGSGAGSLAHPAPPSVLENLQTSKGKSYEEKSKNLPDVVETG